MLFTLFISTAPFAPLAPPLGSAMTIVPYVLKFIGARHLPKVGRGISSPFVEVEIIGAHYDNYKYKTGTRCE